MSTKTQAILLQMQTVVPRSALGYVSDLGESSATPALVEDRLKMLQRHCPELVDEYRAAIATVSERRNITQPADWWAAIAAAAAAESVTVSEWIGDACRKRLPVSVRRGLSVRPGAHRPKKPGADSVNP